MENGTFIDDVPSYTQPFSSGILHGYVSHNQMVKSTTSQSFFLTLAPGGSLEGCRGHHASDAAAASRGQFGDLQLCTETRKNEALIRMKGTKLSHVIKIIKITYEIAINEYK